MRGSERSRNVRICGEKKGGDRYRDRQQKHRWPALDLMVLLSPSAAVLSLLQFHDEALQPSTMTTASDSASMSDTGNQRL